MSNLYDELIKKYAREAHFIGKEWLWLKAQIAAESNFDPRAVSDAGAKGLGQFMDATWQWAQEKGWVTKGADVFDPESNIRAQACNMGWLLERLTTWPAAFAGYNWGFGNTRKMLIYPDWKKRLPDETRNYLNHIESFHDEYLNHG